MACHIRGSVEWWKSEDARQYGGGMPFINGEGELEYPAFYCVPADIFLLARYGTGDLDKVYATFKTTWRWIRAPSSIRGRVYRRVVGAAVSVASEYSPVTSGSTKWR